MKRLVLFVEGEGEVKAAPALVGRLRSHLSVELQDAFFVDNYVFRVGGIQNLIGKKADQLARYLSAARKRPDFAAALLILDGDSKWTKTQPFCAVKMALELAESARDAGAETLFSFAVVILRQEYESILIAVADQIGITLDANAPVNVEEAPRDAKGWLNKHHPDGYRATSDQVQLTQMVNDWSPAKSLRCFRRLEHAINELAEAVKSGQHIVSPMSRKSVSEA